ncbi:MAG: hypothetical protein D6798_03325, partial [Deltaproteobacteria bacterium]
NWIALRLLGTESNRSAIGALIRLDNGVVRQMRTVSGGDSAHSQSDLTQHFGLGDSPGANVEILWPSGRVQQVMQLPANRFYLVDEDTGLVAEALVEAQAVHDVAAGTLTVRAQSNYGGRTGLWVQPMNQRLDYDAAARAWRVVLPDGPGIPPSVRIESERGGSWEIPVEAAP